ncbi:MULTISPECIES: general secretion pathway protein GspB [Vibrio]|uniref:General secretion pathway protein GspB n=3 Tax=Vibrio TaxID=662 RepID=A0A8B5ZF36_VIBCL|nr:MULTISPECIES: general secretion pathway protein GspB [Vibrio]EKG85001.1 general secretion pathway protein B [Vibrio paracholerae HE-16]MBW5431279.1 general secretion pathway protein GspB [Vibrio cholerae]MCX9582188.1 general secretion pathway protein GspB [Vibrio cholerae]MCX9583388.1 general secretion pathway protein GspB [Vibrio cholerae]MDP4495224.1 general secretion pathway protein GspB [Vibrio cholerae]
MSKVMNALKQSQQKYLQAQPVSSRTYTEQEPTAMNPSRWLHLALWLVPGLVTASVMTYQRYELVQQEVASRQTEPTTVQVDAPLERLAYPEFQELQPTFVESVLDEAYPEEDFTALADNIVAPPATIQASGQQSASNQALGDLDLTQLSPELALRVQAIMRAQSSESAPASTPTSAAVALTQHSDRYQGQLPALNFQMHAFSSNEQKRWIKVNGVEYREGDMLTPEVKLESIKPQSSVIIFGGNEIEIPALYDWKG